MDTLETWLAFTAGERVAEHVDTPGECGNCDRPADFALDYLTFDPDTGKPSRWCASCWTACVEPQPLPECRR